MGTTTAVVSFFSELRLHISSFAGGECYPKKAMDQYGAILFLPWMVHNIIKNRRGVSFICSLYRVKVKYSSSPHLSRERDGDK